MKELISLILSLVGNLYSYVADDLPCANPCQVDNAYSPARRGECSDRRAAREAELRSLYGGTHDERDIIARAAVDVEFCDRCKALNGLANAIQPLQHMKYKGWITEWPAWQGKK